MAHAFSLLTGVVIGSNQISYVVDWKKPNEKKEKKEVGGVNKEVQQTLNGTVRERRYEINRDLLLLAILPGPLL